MLTSELSKENVSYTSTIDTAITIHVAYNGWCLSKNGVVGSPLALIECEETRKKVMAEANKIWGFY